MRGALSLVYVVRPLLALQQTVRYPSLTYGCYVCRLFPFMTIPLLEQQFHCLSAFIGLDLHPRLYGFETRSRYQGVSIEAV